MLTDLDIRDFVLITHLRIEFEAGLHVFTGETGAGKSIILDALSQTIGARSDPALVRTGCTESRVSSVFRVRQDVKAIEIIRNAGMTVPEPEEDGLCELVLRRVLLASGGTKSFCNDEPVRVGFLKEIGSTLVEIHAQNASRAFLEPSSHRIALDAFGNHDHLLVSVAAAAARWNEANESLEAAKAYLEICERDRDYVTHAAAELEALDPAEGEEDQLMQQRITISQAEAIEKSLTSLESCFSGSSGSVTRISSWLARHSKPNAPKMPSTLLETVEQHLIHAEAVVEQIEAAANPSSIDNSSLDLIDTRLSDLHAMARKYRVGVEELANQKDLFVSQLEALASADTDLMQKSQLLDQSLQDYRQHADELTSARTEAARALEVMVMQEMAPLKLDHVRFVIDLGSEKLTQPRPYGQERVEFMVSTIEDRDVGTLSDVASGGELSRIMLALKAVLSRTMPTETVVFDEIDTGVGGAVADAIGQRLSNMARGCQVIVISHLPQIAARARHHLLITKTRGKSEGEVSNPVKIASLGQTERIEELARMMSGRDISDQARNAARQLLCDAGEA